MVLDGLRKATACRLASAVLALALTGAPRAALALAPEKPHRCQCRHGPRERCSCPVCSARARQARRGGLAALPPCHRAGAAQALAAEETRERQEREVPCVEDSCGGLDPTAPPRASTESFTLAEPEALRRAGGWPHVEARATVSSVGAPAPDPPPPRRR